MGSISECELKSECSPSAYGRTFYTRYKDNLRLFTSVPRGTDEWKSLMRTHTSSERVNKRILNDYKKGFIDWNQYEIEFNDLIVARQIENLIIPRQMDKGCFLCSEATADNCHRRLVAEHLAELWPNILINHL